VCAYSELHALGTGGPELSGNNDFATLGARLHDEPQDTVAGPSDGQTIEKLVSEGLALGDGGETTVLNLGGVERDGVLGEFEALLDERGELTDAATLLSEDLLCVGGADDDVGDGGGDADLDAGVTLLGQLALEEFVQLSIEDTVCGGLCQPSSMCAIFGVLCDVLQEVCKARVEDMALQTSSCAAALFFFSQRGIGCIVPATNFLLLELYMVSIAARRCRWSAGKLT